MDEMNEMNETMGATVVANEETAISTEVESKGISTNVIVSAAAGVGAAIGVGIGIGVTYIPKAIRWAKKKIETRKLKKLENHYVNIEEDKNDLE